VLRSPRRGAAGRGRRPARRPRAGARARTSERSRSTIHLPSAQPQMSTLTGRSLLTAYWLGCARRARLSSAASRSVAPEKQAGQHLAERERAHADGQA